MQRCSTCLGDGARRRARVEGLSAQFLFMPSPFGRLRVFLREDPHQSGHFAEIRARLAATFGSSVAQGDFRKHTNQCMLLLQGIVRGDWYGAVLRVRAAVNECGFVLEEHPFSGIMMNFRIELLRERAADFNAVLEQQGIVLDATSLANWRSECGSPSRDPIDAMLVILFVDGDPDKTQIVPAVPG